jgi:hypothetical protein
MKHALTILLLLIICNAALSCGPTSILLVNLKTNDLRYCPVGEESDACIKRLEKFGYIRADRLTAAQKASLGVSLPY